MEIPNSSASSTKELSYKYIPWLSSPANDRQRRTQTDDSQSKLPSLRSRIVDGDEEDFQGAEAGLPTFRKHHEASSLELYYDLYFIANLTIFTAHHDIENLETLGSYVGFFGLLWFGWLQASFYDVRFSTDCVLSRICKAISLGVMTGFAAVAPRYDTGGSGYSAPTFRSLSLILMVSRLLLIFEYAMVLWYVRSYKKAFKPFLLTIAILAASALIFLGLFFSFGEENSNYTYDGWYVVVFVEAIAVIATSSFWPILSFKQTHLVERNGTLTLIIIGEGIVGIAQSVSTIATGCTKVTKEDIGVIVAAFLLLYFLWMLYFDKVEHEVLGSIRPQIWTLLHFPLHVAMLLTVEGNTRLIVWAAVVQRLPNISDFQKSYNTTTLGTSGTKIAEALNKTLISSSTTAMCHGSVAPAFNYTPILTQIRHLNLSSEQQLEELSSLLHEAWNALSVSILTTYELTVPEGVGSGISTSRTAFDTLFATTFVYFFIAGGSVLIFLNVLYLIGKQHNAKVVIRLIAVETLAGIGLVLVAVVRTNGDAFKSFILSPWPIPTMILTYFTTIAINNTFARYAERGYHMRAISATID